MSDVWEHSDDVRCTHPGWPTLKGWASVSGSFYNLFQSQSGLQILLSDTEVRIENYLALVFTTENLLGEALGASVSSLNVFKYNNGGAGWRMIAHHASPIAVPYQ